MKTLLLVTLFFSTQLFAQSEDFECSMNGTLKYGEDQGTYRLRKSTPLASIPVRLYLNSSDGIYNSKDVIITTPKNVTLDDHRYYNDETFHFVVSIDYVESMQKYFFKTAIVTQPGSTSQVSRTSSVGVYSKNTNVFETIINIMPYWFISHQVNGSDITATVRCVRL